MSEIIPPHRHHLDRRAGELIELGQGDPDDLLTTRQMADWFGVSEEWLEIGRSKGYGPPFVRIAERMVRYLRGSARAWLRERQYRLTSEYLNLPRQGGRPRNSGS